MNPTEKRTVGKGENVIKWNKFQTKNKNTIAQKR
jgi:hypothetical protein